MKVCLCWVSKLDVFSAWTLEIYSDPEDNYEILKYYIKFIRYYVGAETLHSNCNMMEQHKPVSFISSSPKSHSAWNWNKYNISVT